MRNLALNVRSFAADVLDAALGGLHRLTGRVAQLADAVDSRNQYAVPDQDAIDQARAIIDRAGLKASAEGWPVIDAELVETVPDGITHAEVVVQLSEVDVPVPGLPHGDEVWKFDPDVLPGDISEDILVQLRRIRRDGTQ